MEESDVVSSLGSSKLLPLFINKWRLRGVLRTTAPGSSYLTDILKCILYAKNRYFFKCDIFLQKRSCFYFEHRSKMTWIEIPGFCHWYWAGFPSPPSLPCIGSLTSSFPFFLFPSSSLPLFSSHFCFLLFLSCLSQYFPLSWLLFCISPFLYTDAKMQTPQKVWLPSRWVNSHMHQPLLWKPCSKFKAD